MTARLLLVCALLSSAVATSASDPELFRMVRANDLDGIRAALASGSDVNTRDKTQATPLMHACAFGSVEAMQILLKAGSDVNAQSTGGATALIWAAGDMRRVRLLVDKGADVNLVSKSGRTALLAAAAQPAAVSDRP